MFAIVDIETTGGSPKTGRITEIAIVVHDGNKVVDTYSSLVNPGVSIPPYIQRMTGITDEMVAAAPDFPDVAPEIISYTENCVLVAHNATFDYSFLVKEFNRMGHHFHRRKLCTVRLSRQLLPGLSSYSLGKLCEEIDIKISDRHRAMGDASATAILFERLMKQSAHDLETYLHPVQMETSSLSPELQQGIQQLPQTTGIVYYLGQDLQPLQISRAENIQDKAITQLTNGSVKAGKMREAVKGIAYEETGSKLLAMMLELIDVYKQRPAMNKMAGFMAYALAFEIKEGRFFLYAGRYDEVQGAIFFRCRNAKQADKTLKRLHRRYDLCYQYIYYTTTTDTTRCITNLLGRCSHLCPSMIPVEVYNQRVEKAVASLSFPYDDFLIVDEGPSHETTAVLLVEDKHFSGYGFVSHQLVGEITPYNYEDYVKRVPPLESADQQLLLQLHQHSYKIIPIQYQGFS